MAGGTVSELWRYPVKSMAGEGLLSARLFDGGLVGDRAHAVLDARHDPPRPLTARVAPWLLGWKATYPFAPDAALAPGGSPPATVTTDDGHSFRWGDPRLRFAIEDRLGRAVELAADHDGVLHDLPRSVLVTTEASLRALEAELGAPIDRRRFRPNVHLDLDAEPFAEEHWEGAALAFAHGVVLRLAHPCLRCKMIIHDPRTQEAWPGLLRHVNAVHAGHFGINARVEAPGRIECGEAVTLHAQAPSGAI